MSVPIKIKIGGMKFMNKKNVDLSQMNLLEMPEKSNFRLEVCVTAKGELVLGAHLFKTLFGNDDEPFVKYYYTNDYRIIALQKGTKGDFKFPKSGRIKYQKYANKLEALGYKLPAKYRVEWNDKIQAWVGELQEVSQVPILKSKRHGTN